MTVARKSHQMSTQVLLLLPLLLSLALALSAAGSAQCATATASAAVSSQVPTEQEATTCLRDLNSYLDKLGFARKPEGSTPPPIDWTKTGASVREALGKLSQQLELSRQNPELASEDVNLHASLSADCNTEGLLALAQNLREASAPGACDQPSVDFLMVIANYDLSERKSAKNLKPTPPREAVLNQFARACVDTCWARFVGSVSRGLDRALGKMTTSVFSFVEGLARSLRHMEVLRGQAGQTQEIVIQEGKPRDEVEEWDAARGGDGRTSLDARRAGALRETVDKLRQVKLDTDKERDTFARAVNELYEVYARKRNKRTLPEESIDKFFKQFLVEPCEKLVERVRFMVGQGSIYKNHIRQTLGQALADEKRQNPRLDYELQMFRVCKLANQHSQKITTKLLDIRRRIDFMLGSGNLYGDEWY